MEQKKKIPFDILDSIRGIASLYVAIAHCRGVLWMGGNEFLKMFPRNTWNFWDYAMFGTSMLTRLAVEFVIVFFVLSGFSIAHSLSGNKSPLAFYKRRLIRIYPSYIIALLWAILVYLITRYWHPAWYDGSMTDYSFIRTSEMNNFLRWDVLLKNLFYMPSGGLITPFWSLTYEIIFYLLAPFLLRRISIYAAVSAILMLGGYLFPAVVQSLHLPLYIHDFLFIYNIYFVVGVLLYKYYPKLAAFTVFLSQKAWLAILVFLLLLMYAVNFYFKVETVYSFMVSALLGTGLILFFLQYQVRVPWLMSVGKYSYTLYITHFATIYLYLGVYWLWVKPTVPYILNYFVWMPAVLFVIAVAWIQYQLFEKRTKSMLNKIRKKKMKSIVDEQ